jgi:uncharacterized protein with FMN-binding domain
MKRTLALAGLVFVGLMLFLTPNTGVVAVAQQALNSQTVTTTTTVTAAPPDPGTTTTTSGSSPDTTGSAGATTTDATTTTAQAPSQAVTVVGDAISSPYGPFQVQITVQDGTITDITTLEYPQDRRSQYINQQVLPYYTSAALDAQSTDFSGISGATITWRSWRASLESAIQTAGV